MLILASKSPRRKELLSLITEDFIIKSADVDETYDENSSPANVVEYLSYIKAKPFENDTDIVIGADTIVALEDEILGKPENREDAFYMLKKLSGKTHSVFTGVSILSKGNVNSFSVETKVKFFDLCDEEIKTYIATGECDDKAGAYGIQGKGSLLVEKIDGDYFNVVGLPVSKIYKELNL